MNRAPAKAAQQQDTLRQKEVEEQLRSKLAWLSLDVMQLTGGAQQISIEDMNRADDTHGTRYEASKEGVRLIRYRYVGDRDAMGVVLTAIALSFLLNVIALVCVAGSSTAGVKVPNPAQLSRWQRKNKLRPSGLAPHRIKVTANEDQGETYGQARRKNCTHHRRQ